MADINCKQILLCLKQFFVSQPYSIQLHAFTFQILEGKIPWGFRKVYLFSLDLFWLLILHWYASAKSVCRSTFSQFVLTREQTFYKSYYLLQIFYQISETSCTSTSNISSLILFVFKPQAKAVPGSRTHWITWR